MTTSESFSNTDLIVIKDVAAMAIQPTRAALPPIFRIKPGKALKAGQMNLGHPLKQADIPICTFGPGGEYQVDWYPHQYRPSDSQGGSAQNILSPVSLLMAEIRDLFLGVHPGRHYRCETHPEQLDGCPSCGQPAMMSVWAVRGVSRILGFASTPQKKLPENLSISNPSSAQIGAALTSGALGQPKRLSFSVLANRPGNQHGSQQARDFKMEKVYDTNAQTVGNSYRHPGLPPSTRLFADHAGIGRPT